MIRLGIICPSEIALRRFLPSITNLSEFEFIGVAIANETEWEGANDYLINNERLKALKFTDQYGGKIFDSYTSIIESPNIDAIYLPLPPSLHYKWAKMALLSGKHILIEKPATTSFDYTNDLVTIAERKGLAIHENYMFVFHKQLTTLNKIIANGEIGEVRLYRITFGFPRRTPNDFRYNKELGGGALLDCGGYTIKYASLILGKTAKIVYANSNYINDFNVDIFGSAALVNDRGTTVQIAFGMDNSYKCDLEVWGSKGYLTSGRVLTAPTGYIPEVTLQIGNETIKRKLPADDAFMKSITIFQHCIENEIVRKKNYNEILKHAELVNEFIEKSNKIL